MRAMTALVLASGVLLAAAPARADDRADALKVIDEAITAHGGEEALVKSQTFVRKTAGKLFVPQEMPFAEEFTAQLPGRYRMELDADAKGRKLRVAVVLGGDKGWESTGGAAVAATTERLKELREDGYALWLATLVPLKKEDGFDLAPLPEAKVSGEAAVGVKVSKKGQSDVKLYFDKGTHLLVKVERRGSELGQALTKEELFAGHKEFDGVKLPTKITRLLESKKLMETSDASYRFPKKIDDATFTKP